MAISKTTMATAALLTTLVAGHASAGPVATTYAIGDAFRDQLGGATGSSCSTNNGLGVLACGDAVALDGVGGTIGQRDNLFNFVFHVGEGSNGISGNAQLFALEAKAN